MSLLMKVTAKDKNIQKKISQVSISWNELCPDGYSDLDIRRTEKALLNIKRLASDAGGVVANINIADPPDALSREGGWNNPGTIDLLLYFAELCYRIFNKHVDYWTFSYSSPPKAGYTTAQDNIFLRASAGEITNIITAVRHAISAGRQLNPRGMFGIRFKPENWLFYNNREVREILSRINVLRENARRDIVCDNPRGVLPVSGHHPDIRLIDKIRPDFISVEYLSEGTPEAFWYTAKSAGKMIVPIPEESAINFFDRLCSRYGIPLLIT